MLERINNAITKQYKVVFPNVLNDHNTLFGGVAMKWMDEVAYITATRFTKKKMVTSSTGNIKFRNALESGTIAEIVGKVVNVGVLKIDVKIEIFVEKMYTDSRVKAVEGVFTFVAVDDDNKLVKLNILSQYSSHN